MRHVPADTLTGSEYMALIVSLNCMVAVTKIASVCESDFPLERKSLTCTGNTDRKKISEIKEIKLFPPKHTRHFTLT